MVGPITEWSYAFYVYSGNFFDFTRYPIDPVDPAKTPKEAGIFILASGVWQLPTPIYIAQTENLFQSIIDIQNHESDKWRKVDLLYFLPRSAADIVGRIDGMLFHYHDSLRDWWRSD